MAALQRRSHRPRRGMLEAQLLSYWLPSWSHAGPPCVRGERGEWGAGLTGAGVSRQGGGRPSGAHVVRGEDNEGVLVHARRLERRADAADALVHLVGHGREGAAARVRDGVVEPVDGRLGCHQGLVHGLVCQVEVHGLVITRRGVLLDGVDGPVGEGRGGVGAVVARRVGGLGVIPQVPAPPVRVLAPIGDPRGPVEEVLLGSVEVAVVRLEAPTEGRHVPVAQPQVPLAHGVGGVPEVVKDLGQQRAVLGDGAVSVILVARRVQARSRARRERGVDPSVDDVPAAVQGCPRRRANGRDIEPGQLETLSGQRVHIRRWDLR